METITRFFPPKLQVLLSPFVGGASIELAMAAQGVRVWGYDAFPPLVDFWQCALSQPKALAAAVMKHHPITRTDFYALQREGSALRKKIDRAAAFFVINRASFSGSTLSGGMSPGHPRFTQTSIDRLRNFSNPNLTVSQSDCITSLAQHPDLFAYLDPPYMIRGTLYGNRGDAHRDFDHTALATALQGRQGWILSYNDCEEIRSLYRGLYTTTPEWKYGMSADKASKEILIFSENYSPKRGFAF